MNAQIAFTARNPQTGKREIVDLLLGEFSEGETVTKMFRFNGNGKWITIPGDCLYQLINNQWVNVD